MRYKFIPKGLGLHRIFERSDSLLGSSLDFIVCVELLKTLYLNLTFLLLLLIFKK